MKSLLSICQLVLGASVLAADPTVTIQAGNHARSGSVVTVALPIGKVAGTAAKLTAGDGSSLIGQLDEQGNLVFVEPNLAKGESKRYTVASVKAEALIGVQTDHRQLNFTHTGKPIFTYQMEPGDVPGDVLPIFRHGAHLHPVYTPAGKLVTGNHPPDHRWHRGIWMAWTDTEFEGRHPDFWNQGKGEGKDKSGDKLLAEVHFESLTRSFGGPVQGGFSSKQKFIDHSGAESKDVLHETWDIAATPVTAGGKAVNVIDFVSTQVCAGASPLKLPKYHYGGLGVRGNLLWDPVDKVRMLTSNGDDRIKGDASKGKWVYIGGDVDGAPAGMVVLIHPDNFRFPQPLRLNPKNPQLCIAPSQDGDWSIEPGKPYVSKYRILVMDGPPDAAWIDAQWQDYAEPVAVTVN